VVQQKLEDLVGLGVVLDPTPEPVDRVRGRRGVPSAMTGSGSSGPTTASRFMLFRWLLDEIAASRGSRATHICT
jgi:hypothetical protein